MSCTAHRTHILLIKADSQTIAGSKDNLAVAIGQLNTNQVLLVIKVDSNDASLTRTLKVLQVHLLHCAAVGSHEEELILNELLDGDNSGNLFALRQRQQVDNCRALSSTTSLGDFIALLTVYTASVGEEEDVVVRRGEEEMLCRVINLLAAATGFAYAATLLVAEVVERLALDIALMADGNNDVLLSNEVFDFHFRGITGNFRAALVTEALLHIHQVFLDNVHNLMLICQHAFQPVDSLQHVGIFVFNLLTLETSQTLQAHIQNSLCLTLAQLEVIHEGSAGNICRRAAADGADNSVDIVESNLQAL